MDLVKRFQEANKRVDQIQAEGGLTQDKNGEVVTTIEYDGAYAKAKALYHICRLRGLDPLDGIAIDI